MNDPSTKSVVIWVLESLGYKKLAEHAKKEDANIDFYVRYIKHLSKKYTTVVDTINCFL